MDLNKIDTKDTSTKPNQIRDIYKNVSENIFIAIENGCFHYKLECFCYLDEYFVNQEETAKLLSKTSFKELYSLAKQHEVRFDKILNQYGIEYENDRMHGDPPRAFIGNRMNADEIIKMMAHKNNVDKIIKKLKEHYRHFSEPDFEKFKEIYAYYLTKTTPSFKIQEGLASQALTVFINCMKEHHKYIDAFFKPTLHGEGLFSYFYNQLEKHPELQADIRRLDLYLMSKGCFEDKK